jgi:hypothetical protein
MPSAKTNARYAEVLLKARLIDELQLKSAAAHVERWGSSLPRAVSELGFAEEDQVVNLLAKMLNLPAMHLGNLLKDNGAMRVIGVEFCELNTVFPVTLRDRVLTLAMADPTDLKVVDEAGALARCRVHVVMAGETEVRAAISKHYRGQELPQPRRRTISAVKKSDPDEEKLEFDLGAPPPPPSTHFSAEDLQRLAAVRQNQEKVGAILRTVQELLAAKGFVPRE